MQAKLFWVQTENHYEDWFIVSSSKRGACLSHANGEGFNEEDPSAKFICNIPVYFIRKFKGPFDNINEGFWPSIEMLKALGFEFIEEYPPYVVRGYGKLFYMGKSVVGITLDNLENEKGVYFVNIRNTSTFKIGITNKIKRRLKEFKTSNPFTIDLWFFLITPFPKQVENYLHDLFNFNRQSGEWFEIKTMAEILDAIEKIDKKFEIQICDVLSLYHKN